ncbi:hypothetical protein TSA66_03315 [Noviherbaspirillum autotrophicum]|uniref:Uncharacterized protein n=1 Tax=Noviherbaspirillum autotrophicum TaxID=709839 RepID=A0A0C2BPS8_9BURK|nr:hypothetical protein TSA66_03315 [Noviherbaspirillum autotrophicum]
MCELSLQFCGFPINTRNIRIFIAQKVAHRAQILQSKVTACRNRLQVPFKLASLLSIVAKLFLQGSQFGAVALRHLRSAGANGVYLRE